MSTKKIEGQHFDIYQKFITFVGAGKKMSVVAKDKKFVANVPKKINKEDVWVLAKAQRGIIKNVGCIFFLFQKLTNNTSSSTTNMLVGQRDRGMFYLNVRRFNKCND